VVARSHPVFEDAVGAQLLTSVLTLPSIVRERHDTLTFLNHIYIRHDVRLVVNIDGLPARQGPEGGGVSYHPWGGQRILQNKSGQVVVPLGDLDRHSRATTHITDESGSIIPLFTASELNELLGQGLVAYAGRVLTDMPSGLVHHLRQIPVEASAASFPAAMAPQEAADEAFDNACQRLLFKYSQEGLKLLEEPSFRLALGVITSATQMVVAVDPSDDRTRVLSYSYVRPINPSIAKPRPPKRFKRIRWFMRRTVRRVWPLRRLLRFWSRVGRYISRSGTTKLNIDLGAVGGCERYHLTADAPFDTWFANAQIHRADGVDGEIEDVDTSQEFRLTYARMSSPVPWSGALQVDLRTVYTGVVRASVYGSAFLAACAIAGTLRVILEPEHVLLGKETDAAASLLLLFPGIAASAVAGAAQNTLTATLQFPMRLTLWIMSLLSFVLAVSAAFSLGGISNIVLWSAATAFMLVAAGAMRLRSRQWRQGRREQPPRPTQERRPE
jgi:hypothetical protein